MDEIVNEVAAATGLAPEVTRQALGLVIGFLAREGPKTPVQNLMRELPGADALAEQYGGSARGLLGIFNELSGVGLGMGDMQSLVAAFMKAVKARVGDNDVNQVVAGVPGLGQFV